MKYFLLLSLFLTIICFFKEIKKEKAISVSVNELGCLETKSLKAGSICYFDLNYGKKLKNFKQANGQFLNKSDFPEYYSYNSKVNDFLCNSNGCYLLDTRSKYLGSVNLNENKIFIKIRNGG